MANEEHLKILGKGANIWNKWREENSDIKPNLSGADLRGADLRGADLRGANLWLANLTGANLNEANLTRADLTGAILSRADLNRANLSGAEIIQVDLTGADLSEVDLSGALLFQANLSGADLRGAHLEVANFVETRLEGANLSNSRIYGISAWNLKINKETKQFNLIITKEDEPNITVDNLEVAQFLNLLLHNEKVRHVIDTITSKVVLILDRFTEIRKAVLDAIREELRKRDYLPILFDFEKPSSRNLTETISTLAHMARFVIADLTDAKSIPQELQRIIPDMPSLPIQPLILSSQYEYAMFKDFLDYQSVLIPHRFDDLDDLLATLHEKVIKPAIDKAEEIQKRRKGIEQQLAER